MDSGEIPSDWKSANITPIYKKGSKHQPPNYRPVSLTHYISYWQQSNKFKSEWIYVQKIRVTNLLEFLKTVADCVDKGFILDNIYLDFFKAFDTVPLLRLIEKIMAHSICGKILKWIKNWLKHRTQRVVSTQWIFFNMEGGASGVSLGSLLCSLLFVIFINYIDKVV